MLTKVGPIARTLAYSDILYGEQPFNPHLTQIRTHLTFDPDRTEALRVAVAYEFPATVRSMRYYGVSTKTDGKTRMVVWPAVSMTMSFAVKYIDFGPSPRKTVVKLSHIHVGVTTDTTDEAEPYSISPLLEGSANCAKGNNLVNAVQLNDLLSSTDTYVSNFFTSSFHVAQVVGVMCKYWTWFNLSDEFLAAKTKDEKGVVMEKICRLLASKLF